MRRVRTFFAAMLLATACLSAAQVGTQRFLPQNQVVWSTLQGGIISRIDQQMVQMIPSQNDFQMYWMRATGQPAQTVPKSVNWMKEKLVAVHLGRRESGGYTITVNGLEKNGAVTTIHAIEHVPVQGQWVSETPTSPFVLIRVPLDTGQLRLDLQRIVGSPIPGMRIYNPAGGGVYHPDNYDRIGGGSLDPTNSVNWSTVTEGTRSRAKDSGLFNLTSPSEWQLYWSQVTGDRPQFAPNNNDWSQFRLVAIHLGERPTTGYRVKVIGVEPSGVVRAVEQMPVPGSYVSQRKTYPYIVIRVPRGMGNLHLDIVKREGDGRGEFKGTGDGQ